MKAGEDASGQPEGTWGARVGVSGEAPAWVRRLVGGRGLRLPEKTLYWRGVHLSRFPKHCRVAGREASGNQEAAVGQFVGAMREGGTAKPFQVEQARQALDVFVAGVENWHWREDVERPGPSFRLKATSLAGCGDTGCGRRKRTCNGRSGSGVFCEERDAQEWGDREARRSRLHSTRH